MRINNNLMAMNTHRQLGINNANMGKSIEKLSSGLRINRAGDDAAGLSISEKMRAQIRGLDQASRNAQDGISMVQTAEGALQETQAILQRMRELAVQSSNDTNVDFDRDAIQGEIEQLKSEIDRIGNTTEFNKQSLLKGDGKASLKGTGISSISDSVKLENGAEATTQQAKRTDGATVANIANGETLEYTINGETLTLTFSKAAASGAATDIDGSITVGDATDNNVNIDVLTKKGSGTALTDDNAGAAIRDALQKAIDSNDKLKGNYTVSGTGANVVVEAKADGDFAGAIGYVNAPVEKSGTTVQTSSNILTASTTAGDIKAGKDIAAAKATATIDLSSLEGADAATTNANLKALVGKGMTIGDTQIEFYNSNDGAYKGEAVGIDISTALDHATNNEKADKLVASIVAHSSKMGNVTLAANNDSLVVTAKEGGLAGNKITTIDGGVQEEFKAEFQIGANQGQTMEISVKDMRSDALGIKDIDLSTKEGAQAAITTLENAINAVSEQRSELGAFQNRLEHSIKNLDTSSENLSSAESRVRDVDMAKEMMEQSKNSILSQAAQAMLAQAKQAPQGVLQLLR